MEYKLDDGELIVVSGEWPTNNVDAIKECIKKFEVIKGYLEAGEAVYDTGELETCALCRIYHPYFKRKSNDYNCSPCPIKIKTGDDGCCGSPYEKLRPIVSKQGSFKIEDVDKEIKLLNEVLEEELRNGH